MKIKWRIKQNLLELRKNKQLSLQALAEAVYTTNTTLFRIEKTGFCTDEAIAVKLANVLGVEFDDLFEQFDTVIEYEHGYDIRVQDLYTLKPQYEYYYVFFIEVFEKYKSYISYLPTVWTAMSNSNSTELRRVRQYKFDEIKNYLVDCGHAPAIIDSYEAFVLFYSSLNVDETRVALIAADRGIIAELDEVQEVFVGKMFSAYGLKDCYDWNWSWKL